MAEQREWLPDGRVAVWVGGLTLGPLAAALLSFVLGPSLWVFLIPIAVAATIYAGPSILGRTGTAVLLGGWASVRSSPSCASPWGGR